MWFFSWQFWRIAGWTGESGKENVLSKYVSTRSTDFSIFNCQPVSKRSMWLKGLADAIDQPLIKPDFQRFCAQLELTLDLDRALQELESVFAGPDMNLLASQLRNSLQTGIVGHAFLRMENLMFNRHLALIQARSKTDPDLAAPGRTAGADPD